jgi:hypothetical protein
MDARRVESVAVKYKSPRHAQVWFWERSRRTWKRKYAALKVEQKRWQNRAADSRRARDTWRLRAEAAERRVQELEAATARTEVLESCFGRFKVLEKDQSRGGFTSLLLSFGALLTETTAETIHSALEHSRTKDVWNWCREKLGATVFAKRQLAFQSSATKPG